MLSRLENLLRMSKNGNNNMQEESAVDDSNFIPFSFEGEDFYVVLRSNVMVFDSEKTLIYTIDFNELALSDNEFMKAVNKVVNDNSNEKICLYVNKVSGVESLTFTSLFDATYIFRKLVRLANRDSEGILSIVIEKDAKVVRSYKNDRLGFEKSMPAPIAAAIGSSTMATSRAPAWYPASSTACRSTSVRSAGMQMQIFGLRKDSLPTAFWIK